MATHTPTPWIVSKTHPYDICSDASNVLVGSTLCLRHDDECEANAAFIVQACNSYDSDQRIIAELRVALKTTTYELASIHNRKLTFGEQQAVEMGREALAKSGGAS